jgi:hypothetical protein
MHSTTPDSSGSTARKLSQSDVNNLKPNRGVMAGLLYPSTSHHRGSSATYRSAQDASFDSVAVAGEPSPQAKTPPRQHSPRGDGEVRTVSPPPSSEKVPSWGKPSKKNSLEDDIPDVKELEFAKLNASVSSFSALTEPNEPRPGTHRTGSMGGNDTEQPTRRRSALGSERLSSTHLSSRDALSEESEIERRDSVRSKDQPMKIAPQSNSITQGNIMSEEERKQLEAVLLLSEREAKEAAEETDDMTQQMEESKTAARNLWDVAASPDKDYGLLDSLIDTCKREQVRIQKWINIALIQEGDVSQLIALSENISNAVEVGDEAFKNAPLKPPPTPQPSNSLDIERLVEKQDIFTLICTLRAQQSSRRLDATLALMRFARADQTLRDAIRSSGGMHSLLTLFRTRGDLYELKVVASLAVAYVLPSFIESSNQTPPSLGIKIIECIRFLSSCRSVSPNGEMISKEEAFQAATVALTSFWLNYLGPSLNSEGSLAIVSVEKAISADSFSFGRTRTSTSSRRGGVVFDQRRENIALRELVEMTVALIIDVAKRSDNDTLPTLVEQVCAVEIARPLAVREGILQILVAWLESTDATHIRAATISLRYLTSNKDKYMAGWIHSEMVNKGAVKALAQLTGTHRPDLHMVRLAIAQILSSLCVAPHTRAAVVEANCISFFIGFLLDPADSSSDEVVLSAGSALVQLAVGAITRASVLSEDLDVNGFVSPDKSNSLVE